MVSTIKSWNLKLLAFTMLSCELCLTNSSGYFCCVSLVSGSALVATWICSMYCLLSHGWGQGKHWIRQWRSYDFGQAYQIRTRLVYWRAISISVALWNAPVLHAWLACIPTRFTISSIVRKSIMNPTSTSSLAIPTNKMVATHSSENSWVVCIRLCTGCK